MNMFDVKIIATPIATNAQLSLKDGTNHANAILYKTLIGSFQYLSLTCLDIAYLINEVSQYIHSPIQRH